MYWGHYYKAHDHRHAYLLPVHYVHIITLGADLQSIYINLKKFFTTVHMFFVLTKNPSGCDNY